MRLFRRNPKRLPGSLCDETPAPLQKSPRGVERPPLVTVQQQTPPAPSEAGKWQTRCRQCGCLARLEATFADGLQWVHVSESFADHLPVVGQKSTVAEPPDSIVTAPARTDPKALPSEILRDYIATLEGELADRTRELADECQVNAALRERVRGLELTLSAYAARDGDTVPMPRVRSLEPLTAADDGLLIQPLPGRPEATR